MTYQKTEAFWLDEGFPVFPCNGKVPTTKNGLKDGKMQPWDDAPASRNVGVVTGNGVIVVDVDAYKATGEDAETIGALIDRLPHTLTQTTPSGGIHYFLRAPRGIKNSTSKIAKFVDVRGDGGYVASGHGYEIDAQEIALAPDWLIEFLTAEEKPVQPTSMLALVTTIGDSYGGVALDGEVGKVLSAGEGTRNDTLLRCANRIGGLVASGTIDEHRARSALMNAALSIGLTEKESASAIDRSFAHTASAPRYPAGKEPADTSWLGEVFIRPKESGSDLDEEAENIYAAVASLGGVCGDYLDWVTTTSDYRQPLLAVSSLLALGATVCARRLSVSGGMTSSSLIVSIAPTSSGKGRPQSCLLEAMTETWPKTMAGSDMSSTVATIESVAEHANQGYGATWVLDEYGPRLKTLLDGRSAYQAGTRAMILAMATIGTGSYTEAKSLARGGGVRVIHAPGVTVYGSTTPEALHDAIGRMSVSDGLVGRHVWLDALSRLPKRQHSVQRGDMPASLRKSLVTLHGWHTAWFQGLTTKGDAGRLYEDEVVTMSADASALFRSTIDAIDDDRRRHTDDTATALRGREAEHGLRIALILAALSMPGEVPVISTAHAAAGLWIASRSTRTIARSIEEHGAETAHESDVQRVRRGVAKAGAADGWAVLGAITRACRAVPKQKRAEILADLVEAGEVDYVGPPPGSHGNVKGRWRIAQGK